MLAMRLFEGLAGRWTGEGRVGFPTIPTYLYREETEYVLIPGGAGLRYTVSTWKHLEGDDLETPSHSEAGLIRRTDESRIEWMGLEGTGHLESLEGVVRETESTLVATLSGRGHPDQKHGVVAFREIVLEENLLRYKMWMATPAVPEPTLHLEAILRRFGAPPDSPG